MPRRLPHPRGVTIIEMIVYLALLSLAITATATLYINAQTSTQNTTGIIPLTTALTHANQIANTHNQQYPPLTDLTTELNNLATNQKTTDHALTYTNTPPTTYTPNATTITVTTPQPNQIAFTTYTGNTCWFALEDLTATTAFIATTQHLDRAQCRPETLTTCQPETPPAPPVGTLHQPYVITDTSTCQPE